IMIFSFALFTNVFGQEKNIKHDLFSFKVKSNYNVTIKDSNKIVLASSSVVDSLPVEIKIRVCKLNMNLKDNGINDVSDFSKLKNIELVDHIKISTTISGVSEITGYKLFYTLTKNEYFADTRKTKLIGYNFESLNYIVENNAAYRVSLSAELKVNDIDAINVDENSLKILNKQAVDQIMTGYINLGDINKIIETLKIK
ncbi:MAG: hypothetical protein ACK5LV_10365, partial [Lachnospirales bacterium]